MKSLFKKHYERQKRNSEAVKHSVSSAESGMSIATVGRSHAEADDTLNKSKDTPENFFSQTRSLCALNESVKSQKGGSIGSLKQVVDCGSCQPAQPNSAEAEHVTVCVENSGCERSNRRRLLSESNLPHIGRFCVSDDSADNQKHHNNNTLKQDNVQVIESKIFSQTKSENQDHAEWRARKNDTELHRDSVSAVNIEHQRIQNPVAPRGVLKVPKKVRLWDGESKHALFLTLNL
jgi:hypothetical protein